MQTTRITKAGLPRGLVTDLVRKMILDRQQTIMKDHTLVDSDRWDLSDIFYNLRLILDDRGYNTKLINDPKQRKRIQVNMVTEVCDKLGIYRHDIGIFPADRAQMAFQGNTYTVSFESLNWLCSYGTDVIFIEKEGVVNRLVPFTKNVGIALVQCGGFFSEYALFLAEMSKKEGGNIAILTDFDSPGVTMGLKVQVKNAIRIGADMNTITDLGLRDRLEKIQERVARNTHWQGIKDILDVVDGKKRPNKKKDSAEAEFFRLPNDLKLFYIPYFRKNIDYLEHHRVELNHIVSAAKPKPFWDWLKKKMGETFPTRDYNRAIRVPFTIEVPDIYPDKISKFTMMLENQARTALGNKREKIKEELENTAGFIDDTDEKLNEVQNNIRNTLSRNKDVKAMMKDIDILMKKYAEDE